MRPGYFARSLGHTPYRSSARRHPKQSFSLYIGRQPAMYVFLPPLDASNGFMTIRELTDNLDANAADPKKISIDGNAVEAYSMGEQIERIRFVASEQAARSRRRGLVFSKLRASGPMR